MQAKVFSFQNRNPLSFIGEFQTQIFYRGKSIKSTIAVVKGLEKYILGFKTATDFGLVKIVYNVENSPKESIMG